MSDAGNQPQNQDKDSSLDQESAYTLEELLEEQDSLEAEAAAVLGDSDEKDCSYPHGYSDRQALYACKTCSPSEPAAICLACSLSCHEDHEMYELYTKRNFRCDCGNSKFSDHKCSLFPVKESLNDKNVYNHNFDGEYCRCARPYPDHERSDPEEMHQCVVCEDWFHLGHIGLSESKTVEFFELTCDDCMEKHAFLQKYEASIEKLLSDSTNMEEKTVDVETSEPSAKQMKLEKECKYKSLADIKDRPKSGALWPEKWRQALCDCESCSALYEEQKVSFLTSVEDSIDRYEARGKLRTEKTPDPLMSAIDKMGHVQKMEMVHGYNEFKSSLTEFLRKKAEKDTVVRADDIQQFMAEMKAKLGERNTSVPHFCR